MTIEYRIATLEDAELLIDIYNASFYSDYIRYGAWAESKLGSTEYAGWCLAFIEDALEISNNIEVFGGDSARESCELYEDALQGGVPERGAFVFYDCMCPSENGPANWGHCGISIGDGRVIHAWDMVRVDDYLAIEKLTALTGDHPKYLGWVVLERVLNQ